MHARLLCLAAMVVLIASPASARPPHKQSLKRYYGEMLPPALADCRTCHLTKEEAPDEWDEDYPPHNPFGERLDKAGDELKAQGKPTDIPARLRLVAAEDADGDGVANEVEILLGHQPGRAGDKPSPAELAAGAATLARFAERQKAYPWEPFNPVVRPVVPTVAHPEWVRNPIDAFVAAEHQAHGLAPRPPASSEVLLRRVYLDLTGLPPTPAELHAFLDDHSPDAYEKVVEQLLASPRYGERWGRHWMDVWRYSDWAGWADGKQIRDSQPHIWHWRDWIVESLNADKPYDEMVRQMLAADELYPTDQNALRATGFLARNYKMLSRETWLQDTVQHTSQAFLGLTVGCARCHNHMYDPIEHEEYYQLRAIFEPHNVRMDRILGQSDTAVDGVPRVFDADLATPTYLYLRGDERTPDKSKALQPGVFHLIGSESFKIQPVSLPPLAYYPGLAPNVQQETLKPAEAKKAQAQAAFDAAKTASAQAAVAATAVGGAAPADAAKQAALELAEKSLASAGAEVASIAARIAADNARYATPSTADAPALALAAAKAEREATFQAAQAAVAAAEQKRIAAQAALKPEDEKTKAPLAAAEKAVTEAKQKLEAADKARADASPNYSPLSTVYPTTSSGRRTALARWMTERRNPLTARVAANHIWLRHFGQALVSTVFDFGQNGQVPSNPALVDWLAAELMEPSVFKGSTPPAWSMKHLHRLIVTSNTYRMASTPDTASLAIDPDNHWLWRMPSRRVEAELVRDGVLYVTGQLDLAQGGPDIDQTKGLTVPRRSIYFQHAQEKQMQFLKTFDCAAVTECYERKASIVPQQALALANSELTIKGAQLLATKLNAQFADPSAFASGAIEQVLARRANPQELAACVAYLAEQQKAREVRGAKDAALRARESLVHVLLNHNDFVTIR